MTLDDLVKVFNDAILDDCNIDLEGDEEVLVLSRYGIAAVVRALRDEIIDKNSRCGWCLANGDLAHVNDTINKILGSDADHLRDATKMVPETVTEDCSVTQAAGGPARKDECIAGETAATSVSNVSAPAAAPDVCEDCPPVGYATDKTRCDPCPRPRRGVCEWKPSKRVGSFIPACDKTFFFRRKYDECPSCGKPIVFKEPTP